MRSRWNKRLVNDSDDFSYVSPTVPAGAIFVAGGDSASAVYPSVAAAERVLNPIYAENGGYSAAYGPQGQRYSVSRKGRKASIQPSGEPDTPEDLRRLLFEYLKAAQQPVDEARTTPELAAQVWQLESEFWNVHDPDGERFAPRVEIPAWGCLGFLLLLGAVIYGFTTRDWIGVALIVTLSLYGLGMGLIARRKADKIDYRRH